MTRGCEKRERSPQGFLTLGACGLPAVASVYPRGHRSWRACETHTREVERLREDNPLFSATATVKRDHTVKPVAMSLAVHVLSEALAGLSQEERVTFLRDSTAGLCITVLGCGASVDAGEACHCASGTHSKTPQTPR